MDYIITQPIICSVMRRTLGDDVYVDGLPLDLTPATIKSSHASYPYNPLIAEVLYRSSFLESWGSGVRRMVDACKAQGVPEPEYEVNGGFVSIVFRRATNGDDSVNDRVNEKSNEKIKEKTLDKVYRLISENSKITTAELAELCGVGENSILSETILLQEPSHRSTFHRHQDPIGM